MQQDSMRVQHKEPRQDIWAHYDPKKAREGIRKSAGALKGIDRDRLQREIREQRGQDSTGRSAE
jgi:hypothetical protein